jgi:purine-binding chemotaxis protein CheW
MHMPGEMADDQFLVCRSGNASVALALTHVIETMRPLPIQSLAGLSDFLLGLATIRGLATPVVHMQRLLDAAAPDAHHRDGLRRFVTVDTSPRVVALLVDEVQGVRHIPSDMTAVPPLIARSDAPSLIRLGVLDERLLLVLETARLVSSSAWQLIDCIATSS